MRLLWILAGILPFFLARKADGNPVTNNFKAAMRTTSNGVGQTDDCKGDCCNDVFMENLTSRPGDGGLYQQLDPPVTVAGRPVYYGASSGEYLFFSTDWGAWVIGSDYNSNYIGVKNMNGADCAEKIGAGGWESWSGSEWVPDTGALVRCSDCDTFPANIECMECDLGTVTLTSDNDDFLGTGYYAANVLGEWNIYQDTPSYNGKAVYQHVTGEMCLFFNTRSQWAVNDCVDLDTLYFYVSSYDGAPCVYGNQNWNFVSQNEPGLPIIADETMKVTLNAECSDGPPTAPSGSTSNWDGVTRAAGTIVTYTCSQGKIRRSYCNPNNGGWIPNSIVSCSENFCPPL